MNAQRMKALSPDKKALFERLQAAQTPGILSHDPVAIIGMHCRFPGSVGPERFWRSLCDGFDAITCFPKDRPVYDSTNGKVPENVLQGGFLSDIEAFDADFFGISPREAIRMDPQHRILLEVAWHAIEDAGLSRESLQGSRTGVYMAVYQRDFARGLYTFGNPDAYAVSGTHHSIAANRLSYFLDLHGPSMVIDTACSSSLVALHLACRSLLVREIDCAVVGASNLILDRAETKAMQLWGMLSKEGRCRSFDADADGFIRAEGCGVLILKRADDAGIDSSPARALVVGTAVNQDGMSNGLTAPNGTAQCAVIRAALRDAAIEAKQVGYVETHGAATSLGDPIELDALVDVLTSGSNHPGCTIGAVKSNIGHSEAAAGMAGLIKTILCLEHRAIPMNLHYQKPNPAIALEGTGMQLANRYREWISSDNEPLIAGVSSYGMGGTNAHVILKEAVQEHVVEDPRVDCRLIPFSAHSSQSLRMLISASLENSLPSNITHTASEAGRRTHFPFRTAFVASSQNDLKVRQKEWLRSGYGKQKPCTPLEAGDGLVFVFSGHGSQWHGMGRELLEREHVFEESMRRCDAALQKCGNWSLLDALSNFGRDTQLDDIKFVQPMLFAVQVSLANLWQSWGITAGAVVGHSMGEVAAAHLAGILSLSDAMRIVTFRAQLMSQEMNKGTMLQVELSEEEIGSWLKRFHGKVWLATVNAPYHCMLSGTVQAIREIASAFAEENVNCASVLVDFAAHGPVMDKHRKVIVDEFSTVTPSPGSIPLYSTVTADIQDATDMTALYWYRNIREPVRFMDTVKRLQHDGYRVFLEISPHPLLLSSLSQIPAYTKKKAYFMGSTIRKCGEREQLLTSLAQLYGIGYPIHWHCVNPSVKRVRTGFPPYPFQRQLFRMTDAFNANGAVVAQVEPGNEEGISSSWKDWLYRVNWISNDSVKRVSSFNETGISLLVISSAVQLADKFVNHFNAAGVEATTGSVDDKKERTVVILSALNHQITKNASATFIYEQAVRLCWESVTIFQKMDGTGKIWLVTRGATEPHGSKQPVQFCLWGLARSLEVEFENRFGGIVDLDPNETDETATERILEAINGSNGRWVAFRDNKTLVPRLVPAPAPNKYLMSGLPSDKAYLITGGCGEIGLAVAMRLAMLGARLIVLMNRSPLPMRSEWSRLIDTDKRIAGILDLESRGVQVRFECLDVADEEAVTRFAETWKREARPHIAGIVHAAGVQHPAPISSMTNRDLAEEFRSKVAGTWALSRVFGDTLDFFLLFSSGSTLIGSPLVAGYTAANAFMDAFASFSRNNQKKVTAMQWGLWHGMGMAKEYEDEKKRDLTAGGLLPMEPRHALTAMQHLMNSENAQIGIIAFDWKKWFTIHRSMNRMDYFSDMVEKLEGDHSHNNIDRQHLPDRSNKAEFEDLIVDHIRLQLGNVLHKSNEKVDMTRPLTQLGIDSLLCFELRKQFEVEFGVVIPIHTILQCRSGIMLADKVAKAVVSRSDKQTEEVMETWIV